VLLKDWDNVPARSKSVAAIQQRANGALFGIKDAFAFAFAPPPVFDLGTSAGFDFYLEDTKGQGHVALTAPAIISWHGRAGQAAGQCAAERPGRFARNSASTWMQRRRHPTASRWRRSTIRSLSPGADAYIDDFIDRGRVKHVIVQADAPFRMAPEDFGRWNVRNAQGNMVSVASFANSHWEYGSPRLERYNGVAAMEINGEAGGRRKARARQ